MNKYLTLNPNHIKKSLNKDNPLKKYIKKNNDLLLQDLNLEEAVIGSLLRNQNGLEEIMDIISPDIFYHKKTKEIIKVILKLYNSSEPIDVYTVSNELKKNKRLELVGGDFYLKQLTKQITSTAHIECHSKIIKNKFLLRKLIEISSEIIQLSYEAKYDVFKLLDYAEKRLFEINKKNKVKDNTKSINDLLNKTIKKIKDNKGKLSGIPSGFQGIDKITCGWQKSELSIIAARPGMGKTSFALSMARNIVINFKIPTLILSLEMSSVQLVTRLISSETGIPSERLKQSDLSKLEWDLVKSKIKLLGQSPLFIDDTHHLSIFELHAKCRREILKNKIQLIIIDYLQLIQIEDKNMPREQEVSYISRNLKALCKEFNIPIIALSQLSRAVETRGGRKRPMLSDLRESGALEQDADLVAFLYRPEYYGFTNWDTGNREECQGEAEIIIAKNRNGKNENIRLKFLNEETKFVEV